jgi:predicted transcriptional regulator
VQGVLDSYLEYDARFIEAVNLGLAAGDRGEFVEHDQAWANVEKILQSWCTYAGQAPQPKTSTTSPAKTIL